MNGTLWRFGFQPLSNEGPVERSKLQKTAQDGSGLRRTCLTSPILASALLENYFVLFLTLNIWVCA